MSRDVDTVGLKIKALVTILVAAIANEDTLFAPKIQLMRDVRT